MKQRLNPYRAAPDAIDAMVKLESYVRDCGLEHSLIELVKLRASQINGCAYCIHMHSNDARKAGESEDRMQLLPAWRESPLYSDRERAALAWTEALTLVAETHVPDSDYDAAKAQLTEEELVKLSVLVCTINGWNRLAIGFRQIHPGASVRAA